MEALRLEDYPEAKNRITVVTTENKEGTVEFRNKRGKVAMLNPDLCIGCGVCAYKCPSKSLVLQRRVTIQHPPVNREERTSLVAADFAAARAQAGQTKVKS